MGKVQCQLCGMECVEHTIAKIFSLLELHKNLTSQRDTKQILEESIWPHKAIPHTHAENVYVYGLLHGGK